MLIGQGIGGFCALSGHESTRPRGSQAVRRGFGRAWRHLQPVFEATEAVGRISGKETPGAQTARSENRGRNAISRVRSAPRHRQTRPCVDTTRTAANAPAGGFATPPRRSRAASAAPCRRRRGRGRRRPRRSGGWTPAARRPGKKAPAGTGWAITRGSWCGRRTGPAAVPSIRFSISPRAQYISSRARHPSVSE